MTQMSLPAADTSYDREICEKIEKAHEWDCLREDLTLFLSSLAYIWVKQPLGSFTDAKTINRTAFLLYKRFRKVKAKP